MTLILLVVVPLVVVLYVLIFRMNHAEHFAPQAYYMKKIRGAPVAFEFESLGPRARKVLSSECADPSGSREFGDDGTVQPPETTT